MQDKVILKKDGNIATIIINNPAKRNSLDIDILKQLTLYINDLDSDLSMRALILRGEGEKAFCAGYSIDKIDSSGEASKYLEDAFKMMRGSRLPIIAMCNGIVVGAGLDLCLNCDLRIAADDVRFGITPAKLGVIYHFNGITRLAKTVGIPSAKDLLYTGDLISAKAALEIGLINNVVNRDDLEKSVLKKAGIISDNAPLSIAGTKKILNSLLDSKSYTGEQEKDFYALRAKALQSEDLAEGQKAFMEKRKPVFQGR